MDHKSTVHWLLIENVYSLQRLQGKIHEEFYTGLTERRRYFQHKASFNVIELRVDFICDILGVKKLRQNAGPPLLHSG